jgi:Fe-S cluster biogenesis protein NfuA
LVGIEGNVVKVRLKGMCFGCPMAQMTLTQGIEKTLRKEVPQIERVEQVE